MLCYSVKKRKGQQSYEKKISVHGSNYFSDEYIDRMLGEKKLDAQEVLYEEAYRAINREEPEKEEETE